MAKEIWIYTVAILDLLANGLVIPSMAPYLRMIGASTFMIGVVISSNLVLQIISGPIAVSLSNKKGHCTALQISLAIGCISFLVMSSATTVPVVFLCRAVEGIFHHPQTMCASLLEKIGPHEGDAKMQRWWNSMRIYSAIIGGAIVGNIMEIRGGYHYVCIINAMIFLLNASIAYIFIPPIISEAQKGEKKTKSKSTEKSSTSPESKIEYSPSKVLKPLTELLHIPHSRTVLDVLVLTFLTDFALTAHIQNFAPVLWDYYRTPSRWIGYTLGIQGLLIAFSMSWVGHLTKLYSSDNNYAQRIFHGFVIFMLSSGSLYFASSWNVIIVSIIPMSISYALLKSATSELLSARIASGKLGSVATAGTKMSTLARIFAPLCAGLAYDSCGYLGTSMLKVAAAGTGAVICLSLFEQKVNEEQKKNK